jgi:hypothetical protein
MPSVSFLPVRAQASVSFSLDASPTESRTTTNVLTWEVRPDDDVRLVTGNELKQIAGTLSVRVGTATPFGKRKVLESDVWGTVQYFSSSGRAEEAYSIDLDVSQRVFDRVLRLMEFDHLPVARVDFDDDVLRTGKPDASNPKNGRGGITYGAAPDASEKVWNNETHRWLAVEWCTFHSSIGSGAADDDGAGDVVTPVHATLRTFHVQALIVSWTIAVLLAVVVFR